MRTVELVAPRVLELFERPQLEDPGPGEVTIKVKAVGLCGSDLHWYQDGFVGHTDGKFPMILGHEPVGEVVALGKGVKTHALGDRVAIEPSIVCGNCEYCRSDRPNNCVSSIFMGGLQAPGFYREFANVPAQNAEHFPASIDFITATLIEPVAVVVHVFEMARMRPGDTVAILGAGPIGLLCAIMAKLSGASQIFMMDRIPHRLRIARQIDPSFVTVLTPQEDFIQAVMDGTGSRGVDLVFDCAGAFDTIHTGLHIARPSGRFVLVGIPSERVFCVDIHTAMSKELEIQTIKRSNNRGHEAIQLIASGKIPDTLITHRMELAHTAEGFQMVSEYKDGVGKLVVEIDS
jgi:L-iditol 2-dehydrogenase